MATATHTIDPGDNVFLPLSQRVLTNAGGILEDIASTYCVSTLDVVHALPEANREIVESDRFKEGSLPRGSYGRGYFNLRGDSPIGGHIRASRCREIAFISRPFMGRASHSIQFFNFDGDAKFRIFVRRNADRNLVPEQVTQFKALRDSL